MPKVFFSHSTPDKEAVIAIAQWLRQNADVEPWIDRYAMVPGDSLIEKISEGIEEADRLFVFLTPDSVASNWVKEEVNNGLVMQFAQRKGKDDGFVVPVLLRDCEVPFFLQSRLYADFVNKPFEEACMDLKRALSPLERAFPSETGSFENLFVRAHITTPAHGGALAVSFEFGVKLFAIQGAVTAIDSGPEIIVPSVRRRMGLPNRSHAKVDLSVMYHDFRQVVSDHQILYAFQEPMLKQNRSLYIDAEFRENFNIFDTSKLRIAFRSFDQELLAAPE